MIKWNRFLAAVLSASMAFTMAPVRGLAADRSAMSSQEETATNEAEEENDNGQNQVRMRERMIPANRTRIPLMEMTETMNRRAVLILMQLPLLRKALPKLSPMKRPAVRKMLQRASLLKMKRSPRKREVKG